MEGVKVLEVAQFTFVPASGAVLADWGAEVVKVEHAVTGDAQRGLNTVGTSSMGQGSFKPIMEHPNRGKRSIGLDLALPGAMDVLHELIRRSDVFVTNFLPSARRKLSIELEDVRVVNPDIIYVRGSGFGARGPDADSPGFDGTAYWSRAGSAFGVTPPDSPRSLWMPAGAYGDSIGGMTIAGGIAAALFARRQTGEPSVVDVSLLSVGAWSMGLSVNLSLMTGQPVPPRFGEASGAPTNPIHGQFRTADGRWLQLSGLQPGRYWPEICRRLGRQDLIADERFDSAEKLMANAPEAGAIIRTEIAVRTLENLRSDFAGMEAPWSIVQNSYEVAHDEQLRANGYIATYDDADGVSRQLLANPVQFDETPATLSRAPLFAEHTDEILRELGRTEDEIIQLKIDGAAT
jgi:crotonobetainyl-CoA:carnitine CoA-transferase CaiB-like acyl-CoA transferase